MVNFGETSTVERERPSPGGLVEPDPQGADVLAQLRTAAMPVSSDGVTPPQDNAMLHPQSEEEEELSRPALDLPGVINSSGHHRTDQERSLLAGEIALAFETAGTKWPGVGTKNGHIERAAEMFRVPVPAVKRAKSLLELGTPELISAAALEEVSLDAASTVATLPHEQQNEELQRGTVAKVAKQIRESRRKKKPLPISVNLEASAQSPMNRWYKSVENGLGAIALKLGNDEWEGFGFIGDVLFRVRGNATGLIAIEMIEPTAANIEAVDEALWVAAQDTAQKKANGQTSQVDLLADKLILALA